MGTGIDLAARFEKTPIPAPAVGAMVMQGGETVAMAVRGVRIAGRADPVLHGDPWHIGSCTKAMTATLIGRLHMLGHLDIGMELGAALPGMAMHPDFAAMPLRAVLRHEAGLRRDPHWSVFARLRATRASLIEQRRHISALALAERPLARSGYSNIGYIILGAVIEAAIGVRWEKAIAREVFAPLGMHDAGFGAPPLRAPIGHVVRGGRWRPRPPGPWADNPPLYGPAGRVHLPLADWARHAAVYLGAGPPGYLSPALLRMMQHPGGTGYAAGWAVDTRPGGTPMLHHTGSNTMWFAEMRLLPAQGIGVAVACNAFGPDTRARIHDFAGALLTDAVATFQSRSDALALRTKQ